ncbi:DNA-binding response regulator [Idiomarina tyrosinivorans]|uniref:DNA-binding response regulator n=1 Tax=Idiomarina tyrosinivorans TaxID=1445662 RepID=A0A432ZSI2_9GAMM|nr:response regulator transcription factor [Idiomarina tyrosinivorans]RUO80849.1 DNA-binding response regulator [Idiomarina tyrosinivorans]
MIRVMIVDDQTLVREGVSSLLSLDPSIDVCACVGNGQEAIARYQAGDIDVLLLDIQMPEVDGIATLKTLRQNHADVRALMLTTFDDHELLMSAMRAGALGYLLKDVSLEVLVAAITQVAKGERYVQAGLTERLLQQCATANSIAQSPAVDLSAREIQVLQLVAAGCSNRQIAEALHKSEGTVKNQVSTILSKLHTRDRTRAVLKAIELGLVKPQSW